MLIFYILILCLTQVECYKDFQTKNECMDYVSSILGDSPNNADMCDYRNLKWTSDVDQKNEKNYFRDESECLKSLLSLVEEFGHPGGTKDYCQACQTACQPCSRQGTWIKFNRDAVDKNCYCNMTTCSFQDQGWQWMTIDTEKCSQNAVKDGLGNCIGLQMDRSSKSFEETDEDLEQSAFGRSGSSRIATYPIILLFLLFKQFIS